VEVDNRICPEVRALGVSAVENLATMITRQHARQFSETEMERILAELEAMFSEDAERGDKDWLTKPEY
jgi:hypothetical protein